MCDVALKHDKISMELKDVTLHILPGLSFDVIIGFPLYKEEHPSTYILLFFQREQLAGAKLHSVSPVFANGLPTGELAVGWGNPVEDPVGGSLCGCVESSTRAW